MEKRTWFKVLFGGQGMVMETRFSPARKDVERYQGLRTLNMDLNHRMTKTIPQQAYDDVGRAIGILRKGVLVFDNEDMTSMLMDCCLYDWIKGGKNIVQRYSEQHPAKPETDEHYLLNACLRAKYRFLTVLSAIPGAGLFCRDVWNDEELFLMDIGFSHSASRGLAIATRTLPIDKYWITSGAALPINSDTIARIKIPSQKSLEGPGRVALSMVRACLAAGAAEYVTYITPANPKNELREAHRNSRWRWF